MTKGTLIPIKLPPGVVRDLTEYSSEGRYVDGAYVRFRNDLPEKIGGWLCNSDFTVTGIARDAIIWTGLNEENIIGVGTHSHVYVIHQGTLYDVTPLRSSVTLGADPFETTDTSPIVTVTHTAHGAIDGDYVVIGASDAVGGITPNGEYVISSAATNTYQITHSSNATSSVTGGGAVVTAKYLVTTGAFNIAGGLGWGAGLYNSSTWGTARTAGSASVSQEITYWSLDLWGEDLVMTKRNGSTYVWNTSAGTGTRAAIITNAPITAKFSGVNQDIRILVTYGAYDAVASDDDPMLVRWSDQDDYTVWTASASGEAGEFRLTSGTKIVSKVQSRNQTVIFTDASVYAQQYTAQPFIFAFRLLAEDTTIVGQNAAIDVNGTIFWMGQNNFYVYNGQVSILPSTVRRYVYDNINRNHIQKCFLGINKRYQEVWFFYPRGANTEPSHYAAYYYGDPAKNIWHDGAISRTCWVDGDKFLTHPISFDTDGCYFDHEKGVDANGAAMSAYLETGAIELDDKSLGAGGALLLTDKYIPDAVQTGDMKVTFYTKKYPNSTSEVTKGPYTVTQTTEKLSFRARGRQIRIRHESDTLGATWRMGTPRVQSKVSGRR